MSKSSKKVSDKVGIPAGSLVYVGEARTDRSQAEFIQFNAEQTTTQTIKNFQDIKKLIKPNRVNWLRITGVHDSTLMEEIAKNFDIEHLIIEDIMNTSQLTKVDVGKNFIFFCLKKITSYSRQPKDGEAILTLESDQISLYLSDQLLISFEENTSEVFDLIIERIFRGQGRIRKRSQDYLFYSLLDTLIDDYYVSIENIGSQLDKIEDLISEDPSEELFRVIQTNKRGLIILRKSIFPLREAIFKLMRVTNRIMKKDTLKYLTDIYDHIIQIIDTIESYRDLNSGLKDMYLSSISQKTNQVIQVLTIISTIFIPLTFLAGVYGMNFRYFPELSWRYGYQLFWVLTVCIFGGLIWFFKRKKWI